MFSFSINSVSATSLALEKQTSGYDREENKITKDLTMSDIVNGGGTLIVGTLTAVAPTLVGSAAVAVVGSVGVGTATKVGLESVGANETAAAVSGGMLAGGGIGATLALLGGIGVAAVATAPVTLTLGTVLVYSSV